MVSLNEECEQLKAEVHFLRQALKEVKSDPFPLPDEDAKFSRTERQIISILSQRNGVMSYDAIYTCLYSDKPDHLQPAPEIIKAWMSKIRKKLKHHKIEGVYGVGYQLKRLEN